MFEKAPIEIASERFEVCQSEMDEFGMRLAAELRYDSGWM